MVFAPQTFSFEEVLTSTKMNQMDTNIDEVRRQHKGSSEPPSPVAGTLWLDDAATNWIWKMYDGTDWIQLGKLNPTSNTFSGQGPAILVAAASVGTGTSYDIQDASIDGLSAWLIWFNAVGGNNSGAYTYFQFYNDETLVSAANYDSARNDTAQDGATAVRLTATDAAGYYGYIRIWMDNNNLPFYEWSLLAGNSTRARGFGRYTSALTDIDGFRIGRSSSTAFDSGTVAVYQIPPFQHS